MYDDGMLMQDGRYNIRFLFFIETLVRMARNDNDVFVNYAADTAGLPEDYSVVRDGLYGGR